MSDTPKILYTLTDEAPYLATQSLLPIVEAFTKPAGIAVETRDISLAGRILAQFPELLTDAQKIGDHLAELGQLATTPEANIIKLPNISASVPQLKAAIRELQGQGFALPDYPDVPKTDAETDIKARFDRTKGSAVNPVLREGNSDRRAPKSVKAFARKHPHRMGKWSSDSKSHVAHMEDGDFYGSERSATLDKAGALKIELVGSDGATTLLKDAVKVQAGEIVDAAVMSRKALSSFIEAQIEDAKAQGVLFSLHLKATMMKVSDPILFGHAVQAYFPDVFAEFGDDLRSVGADPDDGLASILSAIEKLPADKRDAIQRAIDAAYEAGPGLAMVDSDRGITNLHVPSDVIIDASMPAAIRSSGRMYNSTGELEDAKFVIPDS
ncbi:MAG: NADP-dependent isocitrate dehydrogenase, partial [Luteimonas sp.]